jgi:hypothetical protein
MCVNQGKMSEILVFRVLCEYLQKIERTVYSKISTFPAPYRIISGMSLVPVKPESLKPDTKEFFHFSIP